MMPSVMGAGLGGGGGYSASSSAESKASAEQTLNARGSLTTKVDTSGATGNRGPVFNFGGSQDAGAGINPFTGGNTKWLLGIGALVIVGGAAVIYFFRKG